jgi:hypothetical protein
MFREDHLDFAFPRRMKQYDKLGCGLLLKRFKHYWLGDKDARLTRQWCEQFFGDPRNFVTRQRSPYLSPLDPFAQPEQGSSLEALFAVGEETGRRR